MMTLEVVVGGMTQRPRVIDGQAEIRDVLDLTLVIDHNVVDGAPATRFGAELRQLIETAAVISPAAPPLTTYERPGATHAAAWSLSPRDGPHPKRFAQSRVISSPVWGVHDLTPEGFVAALNHYLKRRLRITGKDYRTRIASAPLWGALRRTAPRTRHRSGPGVSRRR